MDKIKPDTAPREPDPDAVELALYREAFTAGMSMRFDECPGDGGMAIVEYEGRQYSCGYILDKADAMRLAIARAIQGKADWALIKGGASQEKKS